MATEVEPPSAEPRSLKALFASAEERRLLLEGSYEASSPSYKTDLDSAIADYEACLRGIYAASLFSPNESLEDVSTADLPLLLVDFYLAELIQKQTFTSPDGRHANLERAREGYERFLGLLDNYDALPTAYAKLYSQYTDDPAAFSTIAQTDPAARRNAKIANFKAEKELRGKLEYLRHNPKYLDEGGGGDDEAARAVHLAHLHYGAHMAFQGLEGINRELDILAQATVPLMPQQTTVEEDERRRVADLRKEEDERAYSERLDAPFRRPQNAFGPGGGPLLSKEGRPLQPFTLVGTRQELRDGVFRPGHNLPTMSIDEYLAEERRRGGIIEGGGEASYARPEPDEDNMEKADQETYKAREWDEFTEANPKGWGNTLNRG